jgi:hypothetical protein
MASETDTSTCDPVNQRGVDRTEILTYSNPQVTHALAERWSERVGDSVVLLHPLTQLEQETRKRIDQAMTDLGIPALWRLGGQKAA